jgi:hypothetical protein
VDVMADTGVGWSWWGERKEKADSLRGMTERKARARARAKAKALKLVHSLEKPDHLVEGYFA